MEYRRFKKESLWYQDNNPLIFDEQNPPCRWNDMSRRNSTMDDSWWWFEHIMTLHVNESKCTDFSKITRIL